MGKRPPNPVYDNDLPNSKFSSKYIYFYYLREPDKVDAYIIKRRSRVVWDDMESEIQTIIGEIRNNQLRPDGHRLGILTWRHRGFIAMVMDDREHRLEANNAATFQLRMPDGTYTGGNQSFRDGKDIPLVDTNITGFYCLNHMRHRHGHVLRRGEDEVYWIEANHGHYHPRAHEDAGTNLGPPIGGG